MKQRVNLAMLALVVVWGFNFPIVKAAFTELPPLVFNALRFAGATVLLLLVLHCIEPDPPPAPTGGNCLHSASWATAPISSSSSIAWRVRRPAIPR